MPCYAYRCPECGYTDETVKSMVDSMRTELCKHCGAVMCRDYAAEGFHTPADSYTRELHSDALAIHPSQVEEHKRMYPDVPVDKECRPVFSNYKQHDKYLEKRGIVKPSRRKEIV